MRAAIDLLAQSVVTFQGQSYSFTRFYETFIDRQFADAYLQALVASVSVKQDAPRLQAATARQIVQWLQQQDFYRKEQLESRWLLIFCLYWWSSFAIGYAFEEEIFRDLRAKKIKFFAHDITIRNERLSPFDLTVLNLRGDVKYSAWFLTREDARLEGLDFFITRLYDESGVGWLRVVLLTPAARELIGEETNPARLVLKFSDNEIAAKLGLSLTHYDDWKVRVRSKQIVEGDSTDE
ncbi:MAG: hypothetical protein SF097_23020 [Acidobacteriota bacterium]|nr:hypothetical protein [Acidobacteriota bacterium]